MKLCLYKIERAFTDECLGFATTVLCVCFFSFLFSTTMNIDVFCMHTESKKKNHSLYIGNNKQWQFFLCASAIFIFRQLFFYGYAYATKQMPKQHTYKDTKRINFKANPWHKQCKIKLDIIYSKNVSMELK